MVFSITSATSRLIALGSIQQRSSIKTDGKTNLQPFKDHPMAREISTRNVDLQALTFSPECVAWRRISLGTINHPGMPPRKYLSGGLTLSIDQRARIAAKVFEIEAISVSDASQENQKSRLGLIANMLMAYPMSGGSEESGRARAGAYLAALDDVPPWAIAEAVRRWHRGEGPSGANHRFAPAPAELRYAAMQILQPAKQTVAHLSSLLNALTIERAMDRTPIEASEKWTQPRLRAIP